LERVLEAARLLVASGRTAYCLVAVVFGRPVRRLQSVEFSTNGRHIGGRDSVSTQQWCVRRKIVAGDAGVRLRVRRLRSRRLAGPSIGQRHGLAGTQKAAVDSEVVPEQSQRDVF